MTSLRLGTRIHPRRRGWATPISALVLMTLAACTTVGPDDHLPDTAAARRPAAQGPLTQTPGNAFSADPVVEPWWTLYDDPRLDAQVQRALKANTQLRVAAAHVRHAWAIADEVSAETGPHVLAEAAARRAQEAGEAYLIPEKVPVANEGDAGIQVAYQLDFFGQLARADEAARAHVQAQQAAQDLVRITVVADTVRAYLLGCAATEEEDAAQRQLDVQLQNVKIARRLYAAGRAQASDVDRALAQADVLRAALPRHAAVREAARLRLAALMGLTPQELPQDQINCSRLPQLRHPIPVGDGAALLRRRPDVREAERELAAATARVGVATGDLYPHIVLGASAGLTGILEHLGEDRTQRWGLGPLISWQLPDSGARARVKAAHADADAALARFDGVVLNALRETETAMSAYAHDLQEQTALQDAYGRAQKISDDNHRLYAAGHAPYLVQVDAQRGVAAAQAALAASRARVALDQVHLFLALGGGWSDPHDGPAQPPGTAKAARSPPSAP